MRWPGDSHVWLRSIAQRALQLFKARVKKYNYKQFVGTAGECLRLPPHSS
jgi:hypothetical protein